MATPVGVALAVVVVVGVAVAVDVDVAVVVAVVVGVAVAVDVDVAVVVGVGVAVAVGVAAEGRPEMNRLDYVFASLRRAAENGYSWSVSPDEAGALVAEVERLRADLDALARAVGQGGRMTPAGQGEEAVTLRGGEGQEARVNGAVL